MNRREAMVAGLGAAAAMAIKAEKPIKVLMTAHMCAAQERA